MRPRNGQKFFGSFFQKRTAKTYLFQILQEAMPDTDVLLLAIRAFRSAAAAAGAREVQKSRPEIETARAKVERARDWISESGIGDSACRLYEASRPRPAWARQDDWAKWTQLGVVDVEITGGAVDRSNLAFMRGPRRWEFAVVRSTGHPPDGDSLWGRLTVVVDEVEMLDISVARDHAAFSARRYVDVNGLVVGGWAAELVEMAVVLERAQRQIAAEQEAARLLEQAARIRF